MYVNTLFLHLHENEGFYQKQSFLADSQLIPQILYREAACLYPEVPVLFSTHHKNRSQCKPH